MEWTIIIFGISGDLAKRQIIPALYELFHTSKDKQAIKIIGTARDATTIQELLAQARPFIAHDDPAMVDFATCFSYYQVDVDDTAQCEQFARTIQPQLSAHRIAYLAVSAHLFCSITKALVANKLIELGNQFHRIVYEKPFGWNKDAAQQINECVAQLVTEEQIYRVDHYLTKALVSNILLMRFSNSIFEQLWDKSHIDTVEIIVDETVGIEGRGAYYDRYGALKDVVQNHMLQMLALIALEQPASSNHQAVQQEKIAVLKQVTVGSCIRGQYQGYQQEADVPVNSTTETFVACTLTINQPRWQGVPFYLRTGKCLAKKSTVINITFKQQRCFIETASNCLPNVLTITMAPEEGFRLRLNAKKPNSPDEVTSAILDFCYSCLYGPETPQAYAVLLQSVMAGDRTITVSAEEIMAQWDIVEKLEAVSSPLVTYVRGSTGPALPKTK